MQCLTKAQMAELEMLRQEGGGALAATAIVDFARSPNTALHRAFTWDDDEAAQRYRLLQAKAVIRAAVTFLPAPSGSLVPVRAYAFDAPSGSYVTTAALLDNDQSAEVLLQQMRADVQRAMARYRRHAALAPKIAAVLDAISLETSP